MVSLGALILDGIVLFLLGMFCILGLRSGMLKSILSFVGLVTSLTVSTYLSSGFSEVIYSRFIKGNVISQIEKSINSEEITSDAVLEMLPKFISNSFSHYGITKDNLTNIINSGKTDIVSQVEKTIAPIFVQTIRVSLESMLFFVMLIVYRIISNMIISAFRIPIIRHIDKSIGALFGLLKGYLLINVLIFILSICIQTMNLSFGIFNYNNIESTFIFKYIYTNNIINNLMREM